MKIPASYQTNRFRAYISGMGIISSLGTGILQTKNAIRKGVRGIRPITLFPTTPNRPLPVGEISEISLTDSIPRTHQLIRIAADQAMAGRDIVPDAVVVGTTTGGMDTTESLLKNQLHDPKLFKYHAVGTVAADIARRHNCKGPAITISTACSSSAVAIKFALEMIRTGMASTVLAGGVDALCRLTYYGFNSLQLIDPEGAHPFDKNRRGMTVAEGAAVLLLSSRRSADTAAEISGVGLSCDAYHATKPHPNGDGALAAMRAALKDAGMSASDIDYINLHGTGTADNDVSEARAIRTLFSDPVPPLSSVKGALGHPLAAAGAIEAVISAFSISDHLIPATTGCFTPDAELPVKPLLKTVHAPVSCVLSNSFGFGGNNAAVIITKPDFAEKVPPPTKIGPLEISGYACITGAGHTQATLQHVLTGQTCKGVLPLEAVSAELSPRAVRRLKRLSRMALSLANAAYSDAGAKEPPSAVFWASGWGSLSETYDFLMRLFETNEQFPSPMDFVGSVHNAPAGQIAMQFGSTGPNITTSAGDYSFEQSLLAAHLLSTGTKDPFLLIGADECHDLLTRLSHNSVAPNTVPSDGGAAFCLKKASGASGRNITLLFYENTENNPDVISSLIEKLGGPQNIRTAYGAILAGIPGECRIRADRQLKTFISLSDYKKPVIDYRKHIGDFASASAVAAALATKIVTDAFLPESLCDNVAYDFKEKRILIVGFGPFITAMEIFTHESTTDIRKSA